MLPKDFISHVAVASALGIGALIGSTASAQTAAIAPRVTGPIDESSLILLRGNVPSKARPEFNRGEADPAARLQFMRLVLSRSSQQEAALQQFMAQQLDKSSPNYHNWLTPEQFGKLYGPADSDIAAITAWLESHGLTVESVAAGRNNIAFSGTVAQVEEAFRISIHSFDDGFDQFLSNTSDPSIPAALAPVVSGIAQLNTLRPKPHSVRGRPGQFDPASHRLVPVTESSAGPTPALTTGSVPPYSLYVVPADAATIYNSPNSLNANFASGSASYTGTGVTIGIVGDALIQAATVVDYRTRFLNDTTAPTINNIVPLAVASGDTDEGYLDVEIAGGLAPGANLVFYTSNNLQNAIEAALADPKVDILSLSFGECELDLGNSGNQLLNGYWQQASGQGIAVIVSTGDSGSAGCDNNNTEKSAINGLQVSGFSSTPFNIAVGGTDYTALIANFQTYVNTSNSTLYGSAMGPIPESAWNDSTSIDTALSANIPFFDKTNATNIVAGGGGVSACSTNTTINSTVGTCTSGYPKPSWQRGAGVPNDGARDVPDVSLFAGAGMDRASWLVCTDDTPSPGVTTNCTGTQFSFFGFGGTSTSAPAFAGILALVQQKTGKRLGLAAKDLYDLFNGTHGGTVFHDVTTGNISVVCTAGTPDCKQNGAGNFFLTGHDATAGYDTATGMGSVDVTQLIKYWGTATGNGTASVTVTPSATAITSIQPLTVNVAVAGGLGTPTGSVTLSNGGGGYSDTQALSGSGTTGTASFSIVAGTLPPGANTLTATYSGDGTYSPTNGSTVVTVTLVAYNLAATTPTPVTKGNTATSTVTVKTTNGYTGTVTLSCGPPTMSPAGAVDVPSCTISPATPITLSSTSTSGTATVTFITTAPIATLSRPRMGGWESAGGVVLALLVFLGIPSRRRSWRALAGLPIAAAALLSISACGSSHTNSGGGATSNPGTTSGAYTYTVTGTGNPALTPAPATTITLVVN